MESAATSEQLPVDFFVQVGKLTSSLEKSTIRRARGLLKQIYSSMEKLDKQCEYNTSRLRSALARKPVRDIRDATQAVFSRERLLRLLLN